MLGTGECNVKTLFASGFVNRSEVHDHSPLIIGAVADTQNNQIAFIPLNVFKVFNQQTDKLPVLFSDRLCLNQMGKLRVFTGKTLHRSFYLGLLRFGKGNYTQSATIVFQKELSNQRCNVIRLRPILPTFINTRTNMVKTDGAIERGPHMPDCRTRCFNGQFRFLLRANRFLWNGQKTTRIKCPVAETDQCFVATAVVPA